MTVAGQASATEAASAAVKGSVVVDRGGHMTALAPNTALNVGDRIISMNGDAQIKFADGCSISIRANTVATVGAQSPCAASGLSKTSTPMDFGDSQTQTLLLGFLGVALVAYGVFTLADDGSGKPISP